MWTFIRELCILGLASVVAAQPSDIKLKQSLIDSKTADFFPEQKCQPGQPDFVSKRCAELRWVLCDQSLHPSVSVLLTGGSALWLSIRGSATYRTEGTGWWPQLTWFPHHYLSRSIFAQTKSGRARTRHFAGSRLVRRGLMYTWQKFAYCNGFAGRQRFCSVHTAFRGRRNLHGWYQHSCIHTYLQIITFGNYRSS